MAQYRLYFLVRGDDIECEDDGAASMTARVILESADCKYHCVEIWSGLRMVGRHARTQPPAIPS